MTNNITTSLPYKDRNFVIDSSDKELFVRMKSIVDSGFPPAAEPMLLELYRILWQKKRKLAYTETESGAIYINFPRINPIVRFFGTILLWFTSKDDDEDNDGSLRQIV